MWCTRSHMSWDILRPQWWFTFFYLLDYHAWIWRSITRALEGPTHWWPRITFEGTVLVQTLMLICWAGYQNTGSMIELGWFLTTWLEDFQGFNFGGWLPRIHSCTPLRFILVFLGVDFLVTAYYASLGFQKDHKRSVGLVGNDHPSCNSKS